MHVATPEQEGQVVWLISSPVLSLNSVEMAALCPLSSIFLRIILAHFELMSLHKQTSLFSLMLQESLSQVPQGWGASKIVLVFFKSINDIVDPQPESEKKKLIQIYLTFAPPLLPYPKLQPNLDFYSTKNGGGGRVMFSFSPCVFVWVSGCVYVRARVVQWYCQSFSCKESLVQDHVYTDTFVLSRINGTGSLSDE